MAGTTIKNRNPFWQMSLGERLRFHREAFGLSQQGLAEKLHVTRQAVSGWERDKSEPDIMCLQKIAALYGISLDALLNGVAADRPYEPMKNLSLAFLILGFLFTVFTAWGSFTGRCGFLPLILCGAYCVIINLIFWFSLSGAIKSGDASMLAGYNKKQRYYLPALRKKLDAQRFFTVFVTVISCIPFIFPVFWPLKISFLFVVLVCTSHLAGLFIGLILIQRRYAETLFTDTDKAVKSSSLPAGLFLVSLCLTLLVTALGIEVFHLENNTMPALLLALFMTLTFMIETVCFVSDMKRYNRSVQKRQKYKLHKGAAAGYLFCILLDVLILLICRL